MNEKVVNVLAVLLTRRHRSFRSDLFRSAVFDLHEQYLAGLTSFGGVASAHYYEVPAGEGGARVGSGLLGTTIFAAIVGFLGSVSGLPPFRRLSELVARASSDGLVVGGGDDPGRS